MDCKLAPRSTSWVVIEPVVENTRHVGIEQHNDTPPTYRHSFVLLTDACTRGGAAAAST
jgi:hypothetical protein